MSSIESVLAGESAWTVVNSDCLDVLRSMPDNSVDALVTDPPAGIGFMGREWDTDKGGREAWIAWLAERARECLRVLKPGAHGLVWALPRTSHWTATALEDAGFEIRDVLNHIFGTGFPKSLDLGEGRGTALKPAAEHWILVRKPCDGTTTANVKRWGTGGLEIDRCRIETVESTRRLNCASIGYGGSNIPSYSTGSDAGRWPANVVLSHDEDCGEACSSGCAVLSLDEQAGERRSGARAAGRYQQRDGTGIYGACEAREEPEIFASSGSASRFFYCAKPSPTERDLGCEALPMRTENSSLNTRNGAGVRLDGAPTAMRRNHHPTVKSIALMRWLCRLVTPPGGVVLDPFTGSGTTGCAATIEGARFIGVEQDAEYAEIAKARIAAASGVTHGPEPVAQKSKRKEPAQANGQTSLFDLMGAA